MNRPHRAPTRLDSLIFLALMSGPPSIRDRDMLASLAGEIDTVVLIRLVVWSIGGLWVAVKLYPSLVHRGTVPAVNPIQALASLLIVALSLSIFQSSGVLLTTFTLGQFAVMLAFAWVFADRFGHETFIRHLAAGVWLLVLSLLVAAAFVPDLVIDTDGRFRGERIASTGAMAGMGLILCLSNLPRLRALPFWAVVAVLGVMLVTARIRTAYIGMLVYLAIGYAFGARLRVRWLVPVLGVVFIGLMVLDTYTPVTAYLVRDPNSVQDMSDRVPLWTYLSTAVLQQHPLTGFGYYAASRMLGPQYNPGLGNAHSAFFEVLVGGGVIAAALYVALCVSLFYYAARLLAIAAGNTETIVAVGFLAFAFVLGLTSTEAFHAGPVGFTFWSMTALLPRLWRETATAARSTTGTPRKLWPVQRRRISMPAR